MNLSLPVTELREYRHIERRGDATIPGETHHVIVFDLDGKPHEVEVPKETYEAVLRFAVREG